MIPVAKTSLGKQEAAAAGKVILSGWVTQGPKVKAFEKAFADYVGARYACAVSNCTTALHLALLAVGVKPGDVVITVSHSFIATANGIRLCGAEPVFVDIDPSTYNISPKDVERCLTKDCAKRAGGLYYRFLKKLTGEESPLRYVGGPRGRVAALLVVHQLGLPCDIKALAALARKFHLPVVEDAACAAGSEISFNNGKTWERIGKPHSDAACFSFHPRKILTTGDGGMLTTNNAEYDRQFRILRHQGMSVPDLARHSARKVIFEEYVTTAFNYRMTDIQAAVGIEQLKKLSKMIRERRRLAAEYIRRLKEIPWLQPLSEPAYAKTNWQSFPVRLKAGAPIGRDELMQRFLDAQIATRAGIMNAHEERPYRSSGFRLAHSEAARREVILLPFYNGMTTSELNRIVRLLAEIPKDRR